MKDLILKKENAGFSPLHIVLKQNQLTACAYLVEEGNAGILEPDPNGDTAKTPP